MKNKLIHVKNFVQTHKTALAVAAVTIPVIAIQQRAFMNLNNFLIEENLFDKYYNPSSGE